MVGRRGSSNMILKLRWPHKDHSAKVWSQLAKLVSEEKILNDFFIVEFSIISNGGHVGWERDHRIQF